VLPLSGNHGICGLLGTPYQERGCKYTDSAGRIYTRASDKSL